MEILNLGNNNEDAAVSKSPRAKKLKVAKAAVGIGTLASLTGLGSTLAANISLNGGSNVEFGQGVAQTAACDEDGFTITPVSYYDSESSTFRLDYVEVSGLNLIPTGADESTATSYGSAWAINYSSYSDASAVAAHPGQYYSVDNVWTNTCDEVVLDFKAYTDDILYSSNTLDGFDVITSSEGSSVPNTVSSPLFWAVAGNGGVADYTHGGRNSDIAFIFDSTNDYNSYDSNFGSADNAYEDTMLMAYVSPSTTDATGFTPTGYTANSSFQFYTRNGHHAQSLGYGGSSNYDPAAGAISKITVESMKYFPSDYYSAGGSGYLGTQN